MTATFAAIAPIFILILAGNGLKRLPLFELSFWRGLERLGFYILYPVLLFTTILQADFSALSIGPLMIVLLSAWTLLGFIALALWPPLRALGISGSSYSSVFQGAIRWNGFVALAVAEALFPPEGTAMVALVMAVAIIPINVASVAVIAWFTDSTANVGKTIRRIAANPLIIAAFAAIVVRFLPFALPGPIMDALHLVGRAALGMGLLAIGAGLRITGTAIISTATIAPTVLKLFALPTLVISFALLAGINGPQLSYLALCACVPTAMNGYVLAREMGGDAEGYAITVTLQTVVAVLSIPLVLWLVGQIAGT